MRLRSVHASVHTAKCSTLVCHELMLTGLHANLHHDVHCTSSIIEPWINQITSRTLPSAVQAEISSAPAAAPQANSAYLHQGDLQGGRGEDLSNN